MASSVGSRFLCENQCLCSSILCLALTCAYNSCVVNGVVLVRRAGAGGEAASESGDWFADMVSWTKGWTKLLCGKLLTFHTNGFISQVAATNVFSVQRLREGQACRKGECLRRLKGPGNLVSITQHRRKVGYRLQHGGTRKREAGPTFFTTWHLLRHPRSRWLKLATKAW